MIGSRETHTGVSVVVCHKKLLIRYTYLMLVGESRCVNKLLTERSVIGSAELLVCREHIISLAGCGNNKCAEPPRCFYKCFPSPAPYGADVLRCPVSARGQPDDPVAHVPVETRKCNFASSFFARSEGTQCNLLARALLRQEVRIPSRLPVPVVESGHAVRC